MVIGELDYEPDEVRIRPAATVMLVRDGAAGLEVFMLRRNPRSVFVADAYLFPGGAVDPDDGDERMARHCDGLDDVVASRRLSLPTGGLAFWVAAIRECFEEAGVLLAHEAHTVAAFDVHREAVDGGHRPFADVLLEEDLMLMTDRVHYVSHWLTPLGPPRRYDTRFFVTAMPVDQTPVHDGREAVHSEWIRPVDALAAFVEGRIHMITPTIHNLQMIGRYESSADLLAAAAAADTARMLVQAGGEGERVRFPGE
jgi:8-oxo-dGTP pyrophosphatase MutT (NUDIX family)